MRWMLALLLMLPLLAQAAAVGEFDRQFDDPQMAQRYSDLTNQLRCPKCQNNNVADSNAQIAQDIRARVYDLMVEGQSDDDIVDYMIDRYGRFVTYKPPLTAGTLVIYAVAPLSVLIGIFWFVAYVRQRQSAQVEPLAANEKQAFYRLLEER
ncbi:cytochrome c-type biogenesis protein [Salinibius halmophilus]|uniref:cytochrome c-type biogenesis protein n=1 Tax=Salinibius halmophilus TaxID=1853216 RepID=UPI000E66C395|nr:cytochrome c-type biogenesis protein [Salinibius halmophilus]